MNPVDLLLYLEHISLWIALGLTRVILGSRDARRSPEQVELLSQESLADHPRALLSFHMLAFFLMYFGMANAVFPGHVPTWFRGQRRRVDEPVGSGITSRLKKDNSMTDVRTPG